MIYQARTWQRPLFSAAVIVCLLWVTSKVPPEGAVAALVALLVAGGALYFMRGIIDKGQLTEWLRIWKGRANADQ